MTCGYEESPLSINRDDLDIHVTGLVSSAILIDILHSYYIILYGLITALGMTRVKHASACPINYGRNKFTYIDR
jgi:hypothetical protein